jgi:hypothetical protein
MVKNNSKSFEKHFFYFFFNPLRNNFGKFWVFFFVIGQGDKKELPFEDF